MKKKLLSLLLGVAMVLSLAGCGSSETAATAETATEENAAEAETTEEAEPATEETATAASYRDRQHRLP